MHCLKSLFILPLMGFLLTGCYRMPTENDYSLVPTTNNPAVTLEKNDSPLPGFKM
jgi:hypothetical protein